MTKERALEILKEHDRIGYNTINANDYATVRYNADSQEALNMAIDALEKQRTGHWIECEDEVKCFCSECKEILDYPTKFCPNCGAKMVEQKESEDKE